MSSQLTSSLNEFDIGEEHSHGTAARTDNTLEYHLCDVSQALELHHTKLEARSYTPDLFKYGTGVAASPCTAHEPGT